MSQQLSVLLLLLLAACTRDVRPSTPPPEVTLFISTELRGYLGPCGCSENMRGGLSRAAFQIEDARRTSKAPIHFIDSGDGLFGDATIAEAAIPQQERKAKALAAGWKKMGLQVRAPGPLDDARGKAFHERLELPELAVNGEQRFDGIAVLHATTMEGLEARAARARSTGSRLVVALVARSYGEVLANEASAPSVDLLVASQAEGVFGAEENRMAGAEARVVQVQSKGRSLLRVDVRFVGDGRPQWLRGSDEKERELGAMDERIELLRSQVNEPMLADALKAMRKAKLEELISRRETLASTPEERPTDRSTITARFIPLEASFPKSPSVQAIEQRYDEEVGALNLAWAKANGRSCPPATEEQPGMVGSAQCVQCHHEETEVFRQTKHPRAFLALKEVGKQFHLDCVACHVTGWQQPQGACRLDELEGRTEVGCESCHGPGSAHVESPRPTNIRRKVPESVCVTCHDRENSPTFSYERYLPKVLGPGHGGS